MVKGQAVGVVTVGTDGAEKYIEATYIGTFGALFCEVEMLGVSHPERLTIANTEVRPWDEIPEQDRLKGMRLNN